MNKETKAFLRSCTKHGIRTVAIGCRHPRVKDSLLSSDPKFSVASNNVKYEGWPAVWAALEAVGHRDGCGNSNQKYMHEMPFHRGLYARNTAGEWHLIWEPVYESVPDAICVRCGEPQRKHRGSIVGGLFWCATKGNAGFERFMHSGHIRGKKQTCSIKIL